MLLESSCSILVNSAADAGTGVGERAARSGRLLLAAPCWLCVHSPGCAEIQRWSWRYKEMVGITCFETDRIFEGLGCAEVWLSVRARPTTRLERRQQGSDGLVTARKGAGRRSQRFQRFGRSSGRPAAGQRDLPCDWAIRPEPDDQALMVSPEIVECIAQAGRE